MQITVIFDSLEEFQKHMVTRPTEEELYKKLDNFPDATAGYLITRPDGSISYSEHRPDPATGKVLNEVELVKPAVQEEQKVPETEQKVPETEQKVPETEQKVPETEQKVPEVKVETIRKLLADLNKKAGKNVAKELIKSVGYKKLTDVPQGALLTLQGLAEEEMGKYA